MSIPAMTPPIASRRHCNAIPPKRMERNHVAPQPTTQKDLVSVPQKHLKRMRAPIDDECQSGLELRVVEGMRGKRLRLRNILRAEEDTQRGKELQEWPRTAR